MAIDVTTQISIYPLRQPSLTPAIEAVRGALERGGLAPEVGPMSTLARGDLDATLAALRAAFELAAGEGPVVMTVTLSNACPGFGSAPQ